MMTNDPDKSVLDTIIPKIKDINFGLILISCYLIMEIGSVQGMYPIVNSLRIPLIVIVLTIAYSVILIITGKVDFSSSTTKSYSFFCLFVILYSLITTKDDFAREDLIKVFIGFLSHYIVLTASIKKPSQLFFIINVWLFSILLSSYHGIMQGGLVWGNRWLKDENHISLLVATAIPFAFLLFFAHKKILMKLYYALCIAMYVVVNLIAASRGGSLGMVIAFVLCFILEKNKLRNITILIIITAAVLTYAPTHFFSEMETLSQGTEESTADDRIYLWGVGMKMFYDSPVFGVGLVNYPQVFPKFEKQKRYKAETLRVPHSTPVQWLAETGMVGVFVLLVLQRSLFKNWRGCYKNRYALSTTENGRSVYLIAQSIGIAQIVFWFCALFLSLLPYPFYWILIPFSETAFKLSKTNLGDKKQDTEVDKKIVSNRMKKFSLGGPMVRNSKIVNDYKA